MFVRRPPLLFAVVTVVALLCLSMLLSGLALVHVARAADLNTSAPASWGNGLPVSQELLPTSIAPATQTTSTEADPLSQTPVNPLVPFEPPIANQTAAGSTALSAPIAPRSIPYDGAANVTVADPTSGDATPLAYAYTTHATQPAAENASLAAVPVSHSGGGGNSLLVLTALSYGAAGIVLALMRYWSFSFDEGAGLPPDSRSADLATASGPAYATLEIVDYGRSNHGP
ncbi:MAG: hypothetical protein ACXV4B_07540 [Halobacteriota archaeon]